MQQQYDIGKRLREVMAERGVTISQLAELTDVSEDTIKAIRSGKTKSPGIQLMISIADALGCTDYHHMVHYQHEAEKYYK